MGNFISDTFDSLLGNDASDAAEDAAQIQAQSITQALNASEAASEQGLGFLAPFGQVGQQAIGQAGFLTDPNAQFDFLQSNPLFQLALDNANEVTGKAAASRGRLSAGDTLQQLSNNVLLQGRPLIQDQKNSILDLLGFGAGVATNQANTAIGQGSTAAGLITDRGSALAAGEIGSANAQTAGANNLLNTGLLAGGIFGGFLG
jgi:hypothetical protein